MCVAEGRGQRGGGEIESERQYLNENVHTHISVSAAASCHLWVHQSLLGVCLLFSTNRLIKRTWEGSVSTLIHGLESSNMNPHKADNRDSHYANLSFVIQPWVANNKRERTFILWLQDQNVELYQEECVTTTAYQARAGTWGVNMVSITKITCKQTGVFRERTPVK